MISTQKHRSNDSISGQISDESTETKSDNKENSDYLSLKFSEILFVSEEGLGLRFSMKPCLERRTIRQLIERGGGYMSSTNYSNDLINLVTLNSSLKSKPKSNNEFHYLTFVYDSCKSNTLLDLTKYRLQNTISDNTSDSNISQESVEKSYNLSKESQPSAVDTNLKINVIIPPKEQLLSENLEPTDNSHEIDLKILQFISRRKAFADIIGSRIWTKAMEVGIQFGSNWESTKRRFFVHIMPHIDGYDIEEINKNKFIEYFNRYKDSEITKMSDTSHESEDNFKDNQLDENQIKDKNEELITDSEEIKDKIEEKEPNSELIEEEVNTGKDNLSEKDIDVNEESEESTSKYFKPNERFLYRRKPKSEPKKYLNAYLDFMKQRETSNTPENLKRIKQALKVSVRDQKNDQKSQSNQYSLRDKKTSNTSESKSFGEKVVSKTRDEKLTESESQESGYKVSDISSDESNDSAKSKNIRKEVITSKAKSNPIPKRLVSQKFKSQYTLSEDEIILEFLIKSKRFHEIKGNTLWEEANKKDICQGRSWQSMKERFRKHILPNIDCYDISKKDKQRLKLSYYSEDITIRSQTSSYSYDEDMAIIKSVVHKNGYELVKGNKLWQTIDKEFKQKKVCSRSWQSLRERYLKRIVPNLNKYEIKLEFAKKILNSMNSLNESEKQLIFNKCKKTSVHSKAKKRALDLKDNNSDSNTEIDSSAEVQELSPNRKRSKK